MSLEILLKASAAIVAVVIVLVILGIINPRSWPVVGGTLNKLAPSTVGNTDIVQPNILNPVNPVNTSSYIDVSSTPAQAITPAASAPDLINNNQVIHSTVDMVPAIGIVAPPVGAVNVSTPTLPKTRSVKSIKLHRKDPGIIQIAEIHAYNIDGNLLSRGDFTSITMDSVRDLSENNSNMVMDGDMYTFAHTGNYQPDIDVGDHWIELILKNPQALNRVEVYIRRESYPDRALGTNVILSDENGNVLMTSPLLPIYDAQNFTY